MAEKTTAGQMYAESRFDGFLSALPLTAAQVALLQQELEWAFIAGRSVESRSFDKKAADRLAYNCCRMIEQRVLGERSGVGDALLDYLKIGFMGGPQSVPDWMEQYRSEMAEIAQRIVGAVASKTDESGTTDIEKA